MRFVLDLWPDGDLDEENPAPEDLLAYAVASIKQNPGLVWDIHNDDGSLLYEGVELSPLPTDHVRLIAELTRRGWTDLGGVADLYTNMAQPGGPDDPRQIVLIPLDPSAGDYDAFMALAIRSLEGCW